MKVKLKELRLKKVLAPNVDELHIIAYQCPRVPQ